MLAKMKPNPDVGVVDCGVKHILVLILLLLIEKGNIETNYL